VASAGLYANHLHLISDRQPRQHLIRHHSIIGLHRSKPTDGVSWSGGRSVTIVSPAKTAESIEMPFGLWTQWVLGTMY